MWYAQGPRGSGKTRCGAEALADIILSHPAQDYACVGPTFGDARDTMIEHRKSGLKKVLGPAVTNWNRSQGELYVANGSVVYCDGADDGAERIQGKELGAAWCDEIGLWRVTKTKKGESKGGIHAWQESIEFAVRSAPALIIATGTPKGKKGVVKLLTEEPPDRVVFSFPSLKANERNLVAAVVEGWRRRYAGTRLGRQELEGEIIGDVVGALWNWAMIEEERLSEENWEALDAAYVARTVVALDPAVSAEEGSDETGIIAASLLDLPDALPAERLGLDGIPDPRSPHIAIVADESGVYGPNEWARKAIDLYYELEADRIVYEKNQGGDMIPEIIRGIDPNVPLQDVWASKGKRTRAEPVSAIYEQRRAHHIGGFPELEDEMTTWVPGEESPSRMDAAVWAVWALLIDGPGEFVFPEPHPDSPPSIGEEIMEARW